MEQSIITLGKAASMLSAIETVDDARELIDLAEAARYYAKQIGLGLEAQNSAATIKVRAQRRAGEILAGMEKAKGAAREGWNKTLYQAGTALEAPTLADMGIDRHDSQRWQTLAAMPAERFEEVISTAVDAGNELTTAMIYREARTDARSAMLVNRDTGEIQIENANAYAVERGQVWTLGDHRVMCGDCYSVDDVRSLVGDRSVQALITDPPYGIGYKPDWNKWDGSPSYFGEVIGDDKAFDPSLFLGFPTVVIFGANYFSDKLPIGGWLCWDKRLDEVKDKMFGSPFELAWYRSKNTTKKAIMVRILHGGVVNADSIAGNNDKRYHPTQKPVALMRAVLDEFTDAGETVFDPFCGSGSTLLACEADSRACLAMEIHPDYVSIVIQRWAATTGKTPTLENKKQ
jgi:DNA modification methylase